MTKRKKTTLKKTSKTPPTDSTLKVFISFVSLGVFLTAYAHNNFATKSQVKEIKSDMKDDISEIKSYIKDLNKDVKDLHRVYYPFKEKKK